MNCISLSSYGEIRLVQESKHIMEFVKRMPYFTLVAGASGMISKCRSRIVLRCDRHLGSSAAEMPAKFQSDTIIITSKLPVSRLYEILW